MTSAGQAAKISDWGDAVLISVDYDHIVSVEENLIVLIWKDTPTVVGVEAFRTAFRRMRAKYPKSKEVTVMAIVDQHVGVRPPPEPVRTGLTETYKGNEASIASSVLVFEGTGLAASIVRSVVTAINFTIRPPYPMNIVSTVEDGAQWIANHDPFPFQGDADRIVASVDCVRRSVSEKEAG